MARHFLHVTDFNLPIEMLVIGWPQAGARPSGFTQCHFVFVGFRILVLRAGGSPFCIFVPVRDDLLRRVEKQPAEVFAYVLEGH